MFLQLAILLIVGEVFTFLKHTQKLPDVVAFRTGNLRTLLCGIPLAWTVLLAADLHFLRQSLLNLSLGQKESLNNFYVQ